MSNPQVPIVQARALRDDDELLEGAPLSPASSSPAADGESVAPLAASAYPIHNFEYDEITMARARAQYQQEEQAHREAYPLDHNQHTAVSDDSRDRVKRAERNGTLASETENAAIRRNNLNIFAHDYSERLAFEAANRNARAMDDLERTGRTPIMTENRPSATSIEAPREKEEKDASTDGSADGYKMGGYEVKNYDVGTYECAKYNISEYKSVYD